MAIVFAVILVWFAIHLYVYFPKKLNQLESVFVFMILSIANNAFCSIITVNLGWASAYETPTALTVIILQRIIIIPCLFLMIVHVNFMLKSTAAKLVLLLFSLALIISMEELCSYFSVMNYEENRWLIPVIHSALLFFSGILSLRIFRQILKKGVTMR
ncbi:hypothetical protein [Metabacillus idriensis]|uniref:hypothetical protein n=1 Tax=Metabacillus idriensis TaxID=324768 RepID=UPI003D2C7ED3